ncbi:PhoH family protein [Halodesulfovibrio spirochaetisodalis]|uniref:PhoH-like protein n=1 Tax=Halodesulfovibrio spirochaetisodalis TaxID=1560234 RepID=A0A1B7XJU1_9BACT|nr:PhoH family protein [Halodesulfovibrio spirochaetisodalis]OBQ55766.1 phosphate starvation protein PhoH [Halodesulfovibrio spirochaetisodalis]
MTNTSVTKTLDFDDIQLANELFGPQNKNLAVIAKESGVELDTKGTALHATSPDPDSLQTVLNLITQLYGLLKAGNPVYTKDIVYAYGMLQREPSINLQKLFKDSVFVVSPKKTIAPKTLSQRDYVSALRDNEMVFAVGPAGTGKTYLAVAMALSMLLTKKVQKIILTRPAVEAGEKLGFLPGDLVEKVDPYLRPLYDALHDMLDSEKVNHMLETGIIEVAPLAFMRGRTLNNAFVILDEAQNTTPEQMKMFLTRMGYGSRMVVTGDVTQIDLPVCGQARAPRSGLIEAQRVLTNINGIRFLHFHENDVVRHPLVAKVVHAYERYTAELTNKD